MQKCEDNLGMISKGCHGFVNLLLCRKIIILLHESCAPSITISYGLNIVSKTNFTTLNISYYAARLAPSMHLLYSLTTFAETGLEYLIK
jgi:hypothetical protein